MILATGGTIAGAKADSGDIKYAAGALSISSLLESVPGLSEVAAISAEQVANVGSQDMTEAIWRALYVRVKQINEDASIDGVVVTHGTDTIEETAFYLDLLFPCGKPVVLTGSMRPADSIGADGPQNIKDAVTLAASRDARDRGPMVLLNSKIHSARQEHTENIDAFSSRGGGLLGELVNEHVKFYRSKRTMDCAPVQLPEKDLPKIGIIFAFAGSEAAVVDDYERQGYRGIVLAGVGNGNASQDVLSALEDFSVRGGRVVRSSRVNGGYVSRNIEVNDDESGFIASYDLNPQKSRILLMLALSRTDNETLIQNAFECETPFTTEFCKKAQR
jgi:L-asparaginase